SIASGLAGLAATAVGALGLKGSLILHGIRSALLPQDLAMALGKSIAFGLAIVMSSYRHGRSPKSDAQELGAATTRGVVEASLAVVILDALITQGIDLLRR